MNTLILLLEELRAKAFQSTRYKARGSTKNHQGHVCWRAAEKIEELDKAPKGFVPVSSVREVFSRRLGLHYEQRAYSWHEVQDALAEIDARRIGCPAEQS